MKLLFLILAHDRPLETAELARVLVAAGTDAHAVIHFDANASDADAAALRRAVEGEPRVVVSAARARCHWGGYGLVEGVFHMLAEAEAREIDPDYALLLSGSCLPCRPVAALERFLSERRGEEFIEVADETWMVGGLRSERHEFFFQFNYRRRRWATRRLVALQRALGVRRRFPAGLEPRFGSQWWALTGPTCRAILAFARSHERAMRFFRTVWIPDEMVLQTLVHRLCPPGRIAGHGLTHFQFTEAGKPVVFFDDHRRYVAGLERFFCRKAARQATGLRAECLARAGAADDGRAGPGRGERRDDYLLKVRAQTALPLAGQMFYPDHRDDLIDPLLKAEPRPYIVLLGPRGLAAAVRDHIATPGLEPLGAIFDPDAVDLGPGRAALGGLRRDDVAIRDAHPALYLARVRRRCRGVPVLLWSPFEEIRLLNYVAWDPKALLVAILPEAPSAAETLLRLQAAEGHPLPQLPGIGAERIEAAVADLLESRYSPPLQAMLGAAGGAALPGNAILLLFGDGAEEPRARAFRRSVRRSAFRGAPWFDGFARDLRRSFDALGRPAEEPALRAAP